MTGTHPLAGNHVPPVMMLLGEKDALPGNTCFASAFTGNDERLLTEKIGGGTRLARQRHVAAQVPFRHVVLDVSAKINSKAATAVAAEAQTENTTNDQ